METVIMQIVKSTGEQEIVELRGFKESMIREEDNLHRYRYDSKGNTRANNFRVKCTPTDSKITIAAEEALYVIVKDDFWVPEFIDEMVAACAVKEDIPFECLEGSRVHYTRAVEDKLDTERLLESVYSKHSAGACRMFDVYLENRSYTYVAKMFDTTVRTVRPFIDAIRNDLALEVRRMKIELDAI